MRFLFHYSHFLEILTGIYFGGFALLSFLEASVVSNIYDRLDKRALQAKDARALVYEFFKINLKTPFDGFVRFIILGLISILYYIIEIAIRLISFSFYKFKMRKDLSEKDGVIFQKKFFPAFFYSGCFCMVMILINSVQYEDCTSFKCSIAIDVFTMNYLFSTIIFLAWALIVFPRLVNKYNYFSLTFINISLCLLLFILSVKYSKDLVLFSSFDWFLQPHKEMWATAFFIFVASLPLLFIIINSLFVVLLWGTPISFYKLTILIFSKSEIQKEINKITKEAN